MEQLPLFPDLDQGPVERESDRKWAECKRNHPEILESLSRLALMLRRRGIEHGSMDALFHQLRWESLLTTGTPGFKIDNDLTAPAARELMELHPELTGFFETRKRTQGVGHEAW